MIVTYTNFNGRVVHENRGEVERGYVHDPQGNTVALVDENGAVTDTWEYSPFGEVESHTGSSPTPFTWNGAHGYYKDPGALTYVRARYYSAQNGQWQTVDPAWPGARPYTYVSGNPIRYVDPSGGFQQDPWWHIPPMRKEGCKVYQCFPLASNWGHSFICVDGPHGGCSMGLYMQWMGGKSDDTYGHPCTSNDGVRCKLISTDCTFAGRVCECTKGPADDRNFFGEGLCHGYVDKIRCCGCSVYWQKGWSREYRACVEQHCPRTMRHDGSGMDWTGYMKGFPGTQETGGG